MKPIILILNGFRIKYIFIYYIYFSLFYLLYHYSLNKIFYKGAQIAILVYDITCKESFEKLKSFWHKEILNFSHYNTVFGIAANKSDLYKQEEVDENEAREFAKKINSSFKLTSALENKGINELFDEVIEIYLGIQPTPNKSYYRKKMFTSSFSLKRKKKQDKKEDKKKCC